MADEKENNTESDLASSVITARQTNGGGGEGRTFLLRSYDFLFLEQICFY